MNVTAPAPLGAIAHYTLLERLDPAGPGELYRARDTRLGRTVAVRVLPSGFVGDGAAQEGLLDRARSLIALSHPNMTALFDVGDRDGQLYLVFEFLRGQPLRAEMAGRHMNVRRALELAVQVTDAIADAHAEGFIHGGLSPDSILITAKGHAKVPTFELTARSGFDPNAPDTRLRDYESPEEARGYVPEERSDIYSVGAVLYEMLTTRRPMHRGAAAPSVSNRHVPPELDDVVLRAVAPNPASRIQSAASLAAELRTVAAILDVRGGSEEDSDEHEEGSSGVGRAFLLAVVILAGAAAVIWWLTA